MQHVCLMNTDLVLIPAKVFIKRLGNICSSYHRSVILVCLNSKILLFFSDGGFLAHNATKSTYPAPIPTKKVNFQGNGAAVTDANHNTGDTLCDLPVYNDCLVSNTFYHVVSCVLSNGSFQCMCK